MHVFPGARFFVVLCSVAVLGVAPAAAQASFAHVVAPGETLTSVAAQDGLTVASLAAANGLPVDAQLIAGSQLAIPPRDGDGDADGSSTGTADVQATSSAAGQATSAAAGQATSAAAGQATSSAAATANAASSQGVPAGERYVVQLGDTLSAIAARAGTSVSAVAALNRLNPAHTLLAGITLVLPQGANSTPAVSSPAGTATSAQTTTAAGTTSSGGGTTAAATTAPAVIPTPSSTFVSASQIAQIAAAYGVPAALAEAIAWQESGFNDAEVSASGAVGVMQILPSTWSWIITNLASGVPLDPSSPTGNITAGVLLLRTLLNATGSQALAVAAYYQGLASVQQIGMLSATRQYVANVLALEQRFAAG